jgi:glycerol-3-phosphate dehydrogenase
MSQRRNFSLNAARRRRDLTELAETTVDVLVVGLGVTGAGVALDAASRGLKVAAIDAHDLAFGTSRWSSKLVHGGLRYLAKGQVGIAQESAVERGHLMTRIAPHLIRPLPSLFPAAAGVSPSLVNQARLGFAAADLLRLAARTPRSVLPKPRRLSIVESLAMAPALRREGLRGGLVSWDGQLCDDARLVTGLARAAAGHGAMVLTRCRALSTTTLRDELTGEQFTVNARVIVNATGVWATALAPSLKLRPSRGTHLVLEKGVLALSTGLTVPVPGTRSSYVFALPQHDGRIFVGLTDDPVDEPVPDVPRAGPGDVSFLLGVLNSVLERPLTPDQVAATYTGLRPLLDAVGNTADLSRKHAVIEADGVVTVVGGKLTTYRRMAQDAVDVAIRAGRLTAGPCVTRTLALPGAEASNVEGVPRLLVARYGGEAPLVAALGTEEVAPGYALGELRFGAEHEGALDEADLLDRRTRIGLVTADRAAALPTARSLF